MKYEQKVQVETSEYICWVKRIDGVVAQKSLEQELIRCRECSAYKAFREGGFHHYCALSGAIVDEEDFCSKAERKEG